MNYKGTKRGLKAKAAREVVLYGGITEETREDLYEAFPKEAEKIIANYEDRETASAWAPRSSKEKLEELSRQRANRKMGLLTSMVMALVWVLSKINGGRNE